MLKNSADRATSQELGQQIQNVQSQIQAVRTRLEAASNKLTKTKNDASSPLALLQCEFEAQEIVGELDRLESELESLDAQSKAQYNPTS